MKESTRKQVEIMGNVGGVAKDEVASDNTEIKWVPVGTMSFPGVKCDDDTDQNGHIYIDNKNTR